MNRLREIHRLCDVHPVNFKFVSGIQNPGDFITRPISYKQLVKTNYLSGIEFETVPLERSHSDILSVMIPNPRFEQVNTTEFVSTNSNKLRASRAIGKLFFLQ